MQALTVIPIGDKSGFQSALKIILTKNKWQQQHFDDFYAEFWHQLSKAVDAKTIEKLDRGDQDNKGKAAKGPTFEQLKSWLYNKGTNEEKDIASYSDLEVLVKKDFAAMSEDELRQMMSLLKKISRKIAHQKSRLTKISKKARRLDLKRTFRRTWRKGGEIQQLLFSEPKDKKMKLVVMCDVSKSMDLYSRFLVHFIYAFQNTYDRIETYVFSTALHRVTEFLDNLNFDKAFEVIAERVPQWSGGTRIGACLKSFLENYGEKILDRKTVFIVLSDGWDTGDPEILETTMRKLYKLSKKIIWLNPLAGNPDYAPEVTGLKAAMPYIDVFASAHNLDSLKEAITQLKRSKRKLPVALQ